MDDALKAMGEALVALPSELAGRQRHDREPEVFHVRARGSAPGLPGGSICVVSGEAKSRLVHDVRAAAAKHDAAGVAKLLEAHEDHLLRRGRQVGRSVKRPPAADAIRTIPAITRVAYRGKPVAEGLIVHPDLDAMRVIVPYAGGELDAKQFVASTYVPWGHKLPELETLVVVREPELSPLERKVLEKLPRELGQLAVGGGDNVANWGLAAAGLVFIVVVVAGVLLGEKAGKQVRQQQEQANQQVQQQMDQGQAQQDQQDQGQQDQQDQDAGEQDQGQQDDNGGRIAQFIDDVTLQARIEGLNAGAAVTTLVELRSTLMQAGRMR
jgi:hypothetical protein